MTDDNTSTESRIARRTVLSSLSGALLALSGCVSSDSTLPDGTANETAGDTHTSDPADGSAVFSRVAMEQTDLVVDLEPDVDAEFVNLIGPSGEMKDQGRVREGVTRVTFELLGEAEDGYTPGEYRVLAVSGDSTVGETSISIRPELTIRDVKWAKNNPEMDWDKDRRGWKKYAALTIENSGNAPTYLSAVKWKGAPLSRVYPRELVDHGYERVLSAGETATVFSKSEVYQTESRTGVGTPVPCGELGTEAMIVEAAVQAGENPKYKQMIEYGGKKYECDLSIGEEGPVTSKDTSASTSTESES
ncbi:hypothetical protein C453_01195 [Haloferax elongans ATCC BAA-1513]|uniref:Uncharacterized protein n=1 Tax=Haloferax elongans ATCC BAA-1513 TaxID=1230453 RepID=M0HWD7_HALEO|nr:hypothetical protein [Haloferax elongans]ELZ88836.1 hypothetical protein C453_01195 [Haloferax elongans ATCC BAA-1513]